MKTIGLLGGMSWESTLEYYRCINEEVHRRLGGFHSAKCVIYSVDFESMVKMQHENRWKDAAGVLALAARRVKNAGAEFIVLCTNTMHIIADEIREGNGLPMIHIVDATAEEIIKRRMKKVGLLGTKFTMERSFYKDRLSDKFGISVLVPEEGEREAIHMALYDSERTGRFKESSPAVYMNAIKSLKSRGAEGVILGCTEIPLIVDPKNCDIPLFDTTAIHSRAAAAYALMG